MDLRSLSWNLNLRLLEAELKYCFDCSYLMCLKKHLLGKGRLYYSDCIVAKHPLKKESVWKRVHSGIDGDKSFLLEIVLSSTFNSICIVEARVESLVNKRINRTTQIVIRYVLCLCTQYTYYCRYYRELNWKIYNLYYLLPTTYSMHTNTKVYRMCLCGFACLCFAIGIGIVQIGSFRHPLASLVQTHTHMYMITAMKSRFDIFRRQRQI